MNILFITSTRIGDAVLTTGLLDHLARRYPKARITVACGPAAMPIFDAAPNVVRRIVMEKRKWALHWFDLWRECVKVWWGWNLVVDLRGSLVAHFLIARRRRIYRGGRSGRHRLYALAKVLRLAEPPAPIVWTASGHETAAERLLPEDGPVLALGPTANWRGKIWRAENFIALCQRLTAPDGILPGARIAVFGAADEREIARPVLEAAPADRLVDLVGALDLPTAAAALARCALFVGNDSGLMHIAAAAGTPTLGLFGPSRPEVYAPWGEHAAVVRTAIAYGELFPPDYDHRTTETLMDSLSIAAVEEAAVALWRRCGGVAP
ncbi:MAG: glycosyltransferase family 9 protein [Alphaproteobacteria bacterium]